MNDREYTYDEQGRVTSVRVPLALMDGARLPIADTKVDDRGLAAATVARDAARAGYLDRLHNGHLRATASPEAAVRDGNPAAAIRQPRAPFLANLTDQAMAELTAARDAARAGYLARLRGEEA